MKKILSFTMFILMAMTIVAQESGFTLKGGIGLSSIVGDHSEGSKSAFSYKIGVGYEHTISENFAIEPSLILVNKGFKFEGGDGTCKRFYVELPVLASYKFSLGNDTKLAINAGPYVAYGLLGSDIEWFDIGRTTNIFDSCERFEAGAQIGAKVIFGIYYVGAEFSRAFTKTIKNSKTYNQGIALTFGYSF